ncbi:MAG: glutathione synthetase [Saprospiraceae bacterium]|nr:glutathione synthetase [Saprospiraceae bacterium]
MRRYKVLILTDHSTHTENNSLYGIASTLYKDARCQMAFVASRGAEQNVNFFRTTTNADLHGQKITEDLAFEPTGEFFTKNLRTYSPGYFDLILLRLPRPVSDVFLLNLKTTFTGLPIINDPRGIITCSDKSFLLNFPSLCPPMRLCKSIQEINEFSSKYETVLKPLRDYGGRGILRITGEIINDGKSNYPQVEYLKSIKENIENEGYLAMKYMKQVNKGDKRLIVVGREIIAASLRLPPEGSWLCNVALGGTATVASPSVEEYQMVEKLHPILMENGILIYGLDTLENDHGLRTLSEINALSIGGIIQAQEQTQRPILQMITDKIFEYADAQS